MSHHRIDGGTPADLSIGILRSNKVSLRAWLAPRLLAPAKPTFSLKRREDAVIPTGPMAAICLDPGLRPLRR